MGVGGVIDFIEIEMRGRVVYCYDVYNSYFCTYVISVFLGVFWGGIRYTLHVFFVR